MKVVIVEDEKPSAEHLHLLLRKIDPAIEVLKYLDTVKATVQSFMDGLKADLLFLDIHLADGNGFDIFKQVQIECPVIFTTAFDNYAIQAFKQNSIDYLLKPIGLRELQFALDKFLKQQRPQPVSEQQIDQIANLLRNYKPYKSRFLVKRGQLIDYIKVESIHHFITVESLSFLVAEKGLRYHVDFTMEELENVLPPTLFFRINRKVIIHIASIQKTEIYHNGRLAITAAHLDGDQGIVSRERVNDFKKWLDQ